MPYANAKTLYARLAIDTTDPVQSGLADQSLAWADDFINQYTHRFFQAVRQTRYFGPDAMDTSPSPFTPRGGLDYTDPLMRRVGWSQWPYRRMYVDQDLLAIYSITNGDGTTLPATGYWAEPRNETPHYSIWLKSDFSWVWDTDGWVAVDADWGYSATPSPIVQGCSLQLAEYHYRSRTPVQHQQPLWIGTQNKGDQMPEGFPTTVLRALDPLKKLAR